MKTISITLTVFGIATLLFGVPSAVRAQEPPTPRIQTNLEDLNDLDINDFNQGFFNRATEDENEPPRTYTIYAPAYGAPAHRIQNIPEGIGGPDLDVGLEIYLIELGYRQQTQPNYQQGDNAIQILLFGL